MVGPLQFYDSMVVVAAGGRDECCGLRDQATSIFRNTGRPKLGLAQQSGDTHHKVKLVHRNQQYILSTHIYYYR